MVNDNNTKNANQIATNNGTSQIGNCCKNGSSTGTTKPSNNTGNPTKRNIKHWSLDTALENGWTRFWSDLIGSPNESDNVNVGDPGNSNGDIWGNGWNDGKGSVTSNVNQNANWNSINNKIIATGITITRIHGCRY